VVYQGRRLEMLDRTVSAGGIVRAWVHRGGWGLSTFNRVEPLERRIEQATEAARAVQAEPIALAPVPCASGEYPALLGTDFRQVPLERKKGLIEGYNEILLTTPQVVDTQAVYLDQFSTITYANSEGAYYVEERPMIVAQFRATAREGSNVQQAHEGRTRAAGFEAVLGLEDLARQAASRAAQLLQCETVKGGVYPVVCDPKLAGVFIHEAFGHLSEADFVYANPQAQEMMVLGRRFGQNLLTIADDGSLAGGLGTHPYDDEGTPTRRNDLIREGVLVGRLHARETAARMGEAPTGNARATDYRYPPIVRMTNTFVEPRDATFEDLIRDIKLGVYACHAIGGQTMLENFSFSAGHGYMIREGRLAEMVKDVVLSGNLFSTLQNIDAIGSDLTFDAGMCGKGQGGGLPVGIGAPHLRIQNVIIGGR
jgi:TldD protein